MNDNILRNDTIIHNTFNVSYLWQVTLDVDYGLFPNSHFEPLAHEIDQNSGECLISKLGPFSMYETRLFLSNYNIFVAQPSKETAPS